MQQTICVHGFRLCRQRIFSAQKPAQFDAVFVIDKLKVVHARRN